MNNEYERIDQMQDFLLKNIKYKTQNENGDIIHVIKNGKKRIVNAITHEVTIIGGDGKILYKKILDKNHPIIINAIQYYKFIYSPRVHPKRRPHFYDLLLEENDAKPKVEKCEEIYLIN